MAKIQIEIDPETGKIFYGPEPKGFNNPMESVKRLRELDEIVKFFNRLAENSKPKV